MPRVWQRDPKIECLLVGSEMPEAVRRLVRPGLVPVGHVDDLSKIFDRVRLTVAPLRYGAGVKGKVLASLAAGIPCIMSPIAAEGIDLSAPLATTLGTSAADIAARIIQLHAGRAVYRNAAMTGLSLIREGYQETHLIAALTAAIGGSKASAHFRMERSPTPYCSSGRPECTVAGRAVS
jgi:hypothetical protein